MKRGAVDEATLRAHLGPDGLMRAESGLVPPDPSQAYVVFAQRPDARVELSLLQQNARSFFGAALDLVVPKRYTGWFPDTDAALVTLESSAVPGGPRLCFGHPRTDAEMGLARAAEARAGGGGLYDLARRCPTAWRVAVESPADRTALLLAAIFASAYLGPILSPGGEEIFGVRTARLKLEHARDGYR